MRLFFTLTFTLIVNILFAQYYDDFSDGNFSHNPQWFTENLDATIVNNRQKYSVEMHPIHNGESYEYGYFKTASLSHDSTWWSCNMSITSLDSRGCDIRFYIASSTIDFKNSEALYLRLNYVTKKISFCYSKNGTEQELTSSKSEILHDGTTNFRCTITHDNTNWHIECYDNENIIWSSSPVIPKTINCVMNGLMIGENANSNNSYQLSSINCGDNIDDKQSIKRGELVITEVMADPTPSWGLPEVEWFEVYNTSNRNLDLSGCQIVCNGKIGIFDLYVLEPNEYVAVCSHTASEKLASYSTCATVSGMPSLDNEKFHIEIINTNDIVIEALDYSHQWYENSDYKSEGGWSIERRDPTNPNNDSKTWGVSIAEIGGTPSSENSINGELPDTLQPIITGIGIISPRIINIYFNKELNNNIDELYNSISLSSNEITNITLKEPHNDAIEIHLKEELDSITCTTFTISGIKCVSGFTCNDTNICIASPRRVEYMDLIINEVMFSISGEQSKFVELYNNSDKFIELNKLMVCGADEDKNLVMPSPLSEKTLLLSPHCYAVISSEPQKLHTTQGINPTSIYIQGSLGHLYSSRGNAIVATKTGEIVDNMRYDKEWHHPLLTDQHNVSLERISPIGDSNDSLNWHSASHTCGYNTAGWNNSQRANDIIDSSNNSIHPTSNHFSPNNDGWEDILEIEYHLEKHGYLLTIDLYTRGGYRIGRLCDNEIIGSDGKWIWHGSDLNNKLVEAGLYVITIEATHPDGNKIEKKFGVVVE